MTLLVAWVGVSSFLTRTIVDFAVFVGGVFQTVSKIMAFLLALTIVLIAYSNLFSIVFREKPVCQDYDPENKQRVDKHIVTSGNPF